MDPKKLETLTLIQTALNEMLDEESISLSDFYYQMALVAWDFYNESCIIEAIAILNKIDIEYLKSFKKFKNNSNLNESHLYQLYIDFALEYCLPKVYGVKN